jgi:hypothetical protein
MFERVIGFSLPMIMKIIEILSVPLLWALDKLIDKEPRRKHLDEIIADQELNKFLRDLEREKDKPTDIEIK